MSKVLPPDKIRERLDHPVIDADAHTTEFVPALGEYLKEVGISTDFNKLFKGVVGSASGWHEMTPAERERKHITKPPFWTRPMRRTRDRAAASFPRYMRSRMDEFGCDVAIVYPSTALGFLQLPSEELRRGGCRALNRYHRDAFEGCTDRMIPVGAIPANTPQEAIEELEYVVEELGFRAIVMPSYIPRPVPGFEGADDDLRRWAFWIDAYGLDSPYDYDPFWKRCIELGVSIGTHTQGNGWGSRRSPSNWVYNHIGHFAASGEALCKSLFLGGVTRRFPDLRVALLEGGVGWACGLFGDILEHWETRNVHTMRNELDPALLDQEEFERLAVQWAPVGSATREKIEGSLLTTPGQQTGRYGDAELDEFAALEIQGPEEIPGLFLPNFYFGCEADDPMNPLAFQEGLWPHGATFNAIYGSDIGHFDVPDMTEVLGEAYEPVQKGTMKPESFRDFVYANSVRFYTDTNPEFFAGTIIADDVQGLTRASRDSG